jgi:hypothetical protein
MLILRAGKYKAFVEEEKDKLEKEKYELQQENAYFKVSIDQLKHTRSLFKLVHSSCARQQEQFDTMVEEYEHKLEALEKDRQTLKRENLESLQTLIKELTSIEVQNHYWCKRVCSKSKHVHWSLCRK